MKKFLKPLLIATSVAAVIGVGAVSFAAWEGGSNPSVDVAGKTATISVYGFDSDEVTNPTNNLLPYNQGSDVGGNVRIWSIGLPTITAADATKLQVKFTEASTFDASSKVYVKWSSTDVTSVPSTTDGYQVLSTTATDLTGATFSANAETQDAGYLVVILDSNKTSDMNKDIKITVSVEKQA